MLRASIFVPYLLIVWLLCGVPKTNGAVDNDFVQRAARLIETDDVLPSYAVPKYGEQLLSHSSSRNSAFTGADLDVLRETTAAGGIVIAIVNLARRRQRWYEVCQTLEDTFGSFPFHKPGMGERDCSQKSGRNASSTAAAAGWSDIVYGPDDGIRTPLLGLPVTVVRVDAVDGQQLHFAQLLEEGVISNVAHRSIRDRLASVDGGRQTAGGVGCYLSHLKIWRAAAKWEVPTVVLEDDVTLKPDFLLQLELIYAADIRAGDPWRNMRQVVAAAKLPAAERQPLPPFRLFSAVHLGLRDSSMQPADHVLEPDYSSRLARVTGPGWGTYAYLMHPFFMRELLAKAFPITHQVDYNIILTAYDHQAERPSFTVQSKLVFTDMHPSRSSDVQRFVSDRDMEDMHDDKYDIDVDLEEREVDVTDTGAVADEVEVAEPSQRWEGAAGYPGSAPNTTSTTASERALAGVPHIVHFVWSGDLTRLSERQHAVMHLWERMVAGEGWTVALWTDELMYRLVDEDVRPLLGEISAVMRSDVLRMAVLARYGGVYLDLDMLPLRSLDSLVYWAESQMRQSAAYAETVTDDTMFGSSSMLHTTGSKSVIGASQEAGHVLIACHEDESIGPPFNGHSEEIVASTIEHAEGDRELVHALLTELFDVDLDDMTSGGRHPISIGFIAATAGHPMLSRVVGGYLLRLHLMQARGISELPFPANMITGPFAFGRGIGWYRSVELLPAGASLIGHRDVYVRCGACGSEDGGREQGVGREILEGSAFILLPPDLMYPLRYEDREDGRVVLGECMKSTDPDGGGNEGVGLVHELENVRGCLRRKYADSVAMHLWEKSWG